MENREKIRRWLSALSFDDDYDTHLSVRLNGTCDWILTRPAYKSWATDIATRPKILWIYGPAGFGKTILAANVVKHLKNTSQTPLAYFFCSSAVESKCDPSAIVRSWMAQMVCQNHSIYQMACDLVQNAVSQIASNSEIWQLFRSVASTIPACTFVVDGLDECIHSDGSHSSFLSTLGIGLESSTCQFLIVSPSTKIFGSQSIT